MNLDTAKRLPATENDPALSGAWVEAPVVVTFFFTLLLSGAMVWVLAVVVPRFERIFCDLKVELPDATKMLINCARFCGYYIWFMIAAALGVSAMVGLLSYGVARKYNDRRVQLAWTMLVLAGELFVGAIVVVFLTYCLNAPMVTLIEMVSGSGRTR